MIVFSVGRGVFGCCFSAQCRRARASSVRVEHTPPASQRRCSSCSIRCLILDGRPGKPERYSSTGGPAVASVFVVEEGSAGGFGRVVTLIRGLQRQGNDVRILHGGDFLFPSLESQLWNGEQMVDALNFMDDIAPMHIAPGNHEFDRRTPDAVINAVRQSHFDWLGDNVRLYLPAWMTRRAISNLSRLPAFYARSMEGALERCAT